MTTETKADDGVYRPGYEVVAARIAERITSNQLQPGDRLATEQELSEQLGVSRTVIREAVKLLSATGLIRTRKGSGIYVSDGSQTRATAVIDLSMSVDPKDISSLFEFRFMLETQTVRFAIERITLREVHTLQEAVQTNKQAAEADDLEQFHLSDVAFHQSIAMATHNPFLISTVSTTLQLMSWAVDLVSGGTPGSLLQAADQHAQIFSAIQAGQAEDATKLMQTHVETVQINYEQELRRRLLGSSLEK